MDRNKVIYSSLYCGTSSQSALLIYYIYHNHIVRYLLLKTHSSRPLHSSTWVQANCWLVCKCVLHKCAMKRPFTSVIVFVFFFFSFFKHDLVISRIRMTSHRLQWAHSEQSFAGRQSKCATNKKTTKKKRLSRLRPLKDLSLHFRLRCTETTGLCAICNIFCVTFIFFNPHSLAPTNLQTTSSQVSVNNNWICCLLSLFILSLSLFIIP